MSFDSKENPSQKLISAFYKRQNENEHRQLSQGDLISSKLLFNELSKIGPNNLTTDVYPYFAKQYLYGVVLNSDCDLVWEKGRTPKVGCIQIAAVVEGSEHISDLLREVSDEDNYKYRVIDLRTYGDVVRKFIQLVNCQEKLFFYLPECPELEFKAAHVVRLDTSVSFKIDTEEKYKAFVSSKLSHSLTDSYKSKLGESFASLFDRIGLTDADDILAEDYKSWTTKEMEKYFIPPIKLEVYKRSIGEIRSLNVEDENYEEQLFSIIQKNMTVNEDDFLTKKSYVALEKIVKGNTKEYLALKILADIRKNPDLQKLFLNS